MKKILLTLMVFGSFGAFAEDEFVEMHLLAADSVWVRDMNMSIPILSEDYNCGFINENGSYAENVKSSSKRYHYQATGIDPINPKSSLKDYLIKTNDRNFYCGFNDRAEAMKAIRAVMLKCINSGWDSCLIGGTGDKETDGWLMHGKNPLKREQLVKEKIVMNQNKVQQELKRKQQEEILKSDELIPAASGSGFFITDNGHILTNEHVIEGCKKITLSNEGKETPAFLLASDSKNDLALLKANVSSEDFYKLSPQDAKLLDNVIIAGYPLGKRVSSAVKTSKGSITSLAGYGDDYSNFQTDAALNQGNSGGPIIDESGGVIGVAVANYGKKAGIESFNFGIKSSVVKAFIEANNISYLSSSRKELSNAQLRELIINGTIYLECWLSEDDINNMMSQSDNRKAFYKNSQN